MEVGFENTLGGRSVLFGASADTVVLRDDNHYQYLMAGAGDDRVHLFDPVSGTNVYGGPGADVLTVCDIAESEISLLVSLGDGASHADVDADVVVLSAAMFREVREGFVRRISIHEFLPANDRLVLVLPAGLDVAFEDRGTGATLLWVDDVMIEIFRTDQLGRPFDWDAVVLLPESLAPEMLGAEAAPPQQETPGGTWRSEEARSLAGNAMTFDGPQPGCREILNAEPEKKFSEPVNTPDTKESYLLQAYSREDDLIRLAGTRQSIRVRAGQGDDSLYLSDIGDDIRVEGNSGSDLIALCSMHGAVLHLEPGSGAIDAQPDTIVIEPPVFRNVPDGIRREIWITGFNPINDRLLLRIPDGMKVESSGSGKTLRIGSVEIIMNAPLFMDDLPFRDAVVTVASTRE